MYIVIRGSANTVNVLYHRNTSHVYILTFPHTAHPPHLHCSILAEQCLHHPLHYPLFQSPCPPPVQLTHQHHLTHLSEYAEKRNEANVWSMVTTRQLARSPSSSPSLCSLYFATSDPQIVPPASLSAPNTSLHKSKITTITKYSTSIHHTHARTHTRTHTTTTTTTTTAAQPTFNLSASSCCALSLS